MDTLGHAVGVLCHVTGPDGALIYDATSGIVPFTYDADPEQYTPGWHLRRRIRSAALEPSASCLRYAGSADLTVRRLSRTLACTNVVIELAVQPSAYNAGGGVFVVGVTDGSNNGYQVNWSKDDHAVLYRFNAGTPTSINAGAGTQKFGDINRFHRIKLSIQSGAIKVWLDGELQASATDATFGSFTTLYIEGLGINCDVRCLSVRTSDTVTVAGLTPGTSCVVRGYGGLPAGSVVANASGTGTFTHSHYPLWSLDVRSVDYTPSGGVCGGDTLTFSGLPAAMAPARLVMGF